MVTDKQLQANQINALSSTGPQTPEGKEVSKMNAVKHGLLSREVLLENENENELVDFGKRMRSCLKPAGELELLLVDQVISYSWRLRRVFNVEKAIMELQATDSFNIFPGDKSTKRDELRLIRDMIDNDSIEKLTRYEVMIVKHLYKAMHELIRVQAMRSGDKPPLPVAVDIDND